MRPALPLRPLIAAPLFVMGLFLLLTACAAEPMPAPETKAAEEAEESREAPPPQILIAIAHTRGMNSPLQLALDEADQALRRESEGRMAFAFYPDAQLGDDAELLSYVYSGLLQMALPLASAWADAPANAKDWATSPGDWGAAAVYALPWLYAEPGAAIKAADALHEMSAAYLGAGALRLGYLSAESYAMVNSRGPVSVPGDIEGLLFGSASAATSLSVNRQLKATTKQYRYYEIAGALKEGRISAAAAPLAQAVAESWAEHAPWLYLSGQNHQICAITVNQAWYEALAPTDRAVLDAVLAALPAGVDYYRQRGEAAMLATLETAGVDIRHADAEAIAAFRERMRPLYDDYARKYPDLFALASGR